MRDQDTGSLEFEQQSIEGTGVEPYVVSKTVSDAVSHPSHYTRGRIEVIEYIEDQKFNFNLGNAIKYISRAGYKKDAIEDLQKAIWYLEREISYLTKERNNV